ncbi:MAG: transglutaminase-like domain-containing protein [Candidatus Micrarchaeota archaeon]
MKLFYLGIFAIILTGCCGFVPDPDVPYDPILTCSDGTKYGYCSYTKPLFCSDGVLVNNTAGCGCPQGQVVHGTVCGYPRPIKPRQNYTFSTYENTEPYLSTYCDKIDPYDLSVREAAADAIRNHPGSYSYTQLFDIYDWVKQNIIYQNVPLAGIPYPSYETLLTRSGDCKNQAVLIASMVGAIGGTAKTVADPDCVHAYTIVYFGSVDKLDSFIQAVSNHYGSDVFVNYFILDDGIWVIFDPAGGEYPGDTLPECTGDRTVYLVTTCLECSNIYNDKPYSYDDMCYSKCPSGTVSSSPYSCTPCPSGYYSCNDKCLTCQLGYYMANNCMCYKN